MNSNFVSLRDFPPCSTPLTGALQRLTLHRQEDELIQAIEEANVLEVQRLLELGCDPNYKNASGKTLLEVTLNHFDTKDPSDKIGAACSIIQLLIEHGASYTQPIKEYLNIFDYAFANVNYGLLFALRNYYKCEIKVNSWSTFFTKCDSKELAFVGTYYPNLYKEFFIITNVNNYIMSFDKYHALTQNKTSLSFPLIPFFPCPTDFEQLLKMTPNIPVQEVLCLLAMGLGNAKCLEVVVRHGADPLLATVTFASPLDIALKSKNIQFLFELQKIKGPQILPRPSLHEAILAKDLARIERELPTFDLTTQDCIGDTALRRAICSCFLPAVKLLSQKLTADDLLFAVCTSSVEVVQFLVTVIEVDEEMAKTMFNQAIEHGTLEVARWIVAEYAFQYPFTFGEDFFCKTYGTDSISTLQKFVSEMIASPDTKELLGAFFIAAANSNKSEILSFLLEQTPDLSVFDYEDAPTDFYRTLFTYCETEFVEKVIKKIGIHDDCYGWSHILEQLLEKHEPLFNTLLPQMYTRITTLFQTAQEDTYLFAYAFIAVCHAPFEIIEKLTNEYRVKNEPLVDHLLCTAITRRNHKLVEFFLTFEHSGNYLFRALRIKDEPIIQTLLQWYTKHRPHNNGVRELFSSWARKDKNYLRQVVALQRPDFSPDEQEEMASWILDTETSYFLCERVIEWMYEGLSISGIKQVQKLFLACRLPFGPFTIKQTGDWFIKSLRKVHPSFFTDALFVDTTFARLSEMQEPEEYVSILNKKAASGFLCMDSFSLALPLLVQSPKLIEKRDALGRTELFLASLQGNLSEVKKLLTLGFDPNSMDDQGVSVLEAVVLSCKEAGNKNPKAYSIAQALVAKGALCTRMIGKDYLNIFDFAITTCNYGLLFALHRYYKPHIKLQMKAWELFSSCKEQDLEFITRYYPTLEPRLNGKLNTICHSFISQKKLGLLIKYSQIAPHHFKKFIEERSSDLFSLLESALRGNYPEAVAFLRKAGSTLHKDPRLLIISPEITKQLIAEGMNPNEQDEDGDSALHSIAMNEDEYDACLFVLLDHGADIHLPGKEGKTPLQRAIDTENTFFLSVVSKAQKSITPPPLHAAILAKDIPKIKSLLATSDLNERDTFDNTAFDTAVLNHCFEAVQLLADEDNLRYIYLSFAAMYSSVEIFSFLFSRATIPVNENTIWNFFLDATSRQNTPVVLWIAENYAHQYPFTELLEYLRKHGSKERVQETISKIQDKQGPLLQALMAKNLPLATLLLRSMDKQIVCNTRLYSYQFDQNDKEFIEEMLQKKEFAFAIFLHTNAFEILYKNQPEIFEQLFEELLVLSRQDKEGRYLFSLVTVAIFTGKFSLVEKCFFEFPDYHRLLSANVIRDFLKSAIIIGHAEMVAYFYKKLLDLSLDSELLLAINLGNEEVIRALKPYADQKIRLTLLPLFKLILAQTDRDPKEALIRTIRLQRTDLTLQELEDLALLLMSSTEFPMVLDIIAHGCRWDSPLQLKENKQVLLTLMPRLAAICRVPYEHRSINETVQWLLGQICFHCRQMNPVLFSDRSVYDTILDLVAKVSRNEDYGALIVAVQVALNKETASLAFQTAQRFEGGGFLKPTKTAFLQSSEEEQKAWLAYACVYRDRSFIPHCYYIIKHYESLLPLLLDALNTIQHIGVARYNSQLENSLTTTIQNVLQNCQNEKIKIAALKAYIGVSPLSHNPKLLDFLHLLLEEARTCSFPAFEIEVAYCLGRLYEWTLDQECAKTVELLTAGLKSQDADVRFHTTIALTSIPHEQGLLAALASVQSTTWDRMLPYFGKDACSISSSFLHFRSYPDWLHNNRGAMVRRICQQLIHLQKNNKQFCAKVEHYPNASKMVQVVEENWQLMGSYNIRYVPLPVAYPPNTDLIRGLSTRKGGLKFREAVKDLIRKGSGSSQLTDYDACIEHGTWSKIGHIFASHNKDLFFGKETGSPYFSVDKNGVISESALIVFPASYYEKEYLAGQARLEREGTFNNVLYRGIPRSWIKAIYLPEQYKEDIEVLASDTPIEGIIFTSDLFKGETLKELECFRRFLTSEEIDLTKEPAKPIPLPIPLVKKIRYLPEVNAKKAEEILLQDGIQLATEEEVKKETAKLRIKLSVLINEYYENPFRFYTQDVLLLKANDKEFKEHIDLFCAMLPQSMHPLDGAKKCLLELSTDHDVARRAILRVAALLRGVGMRIQDLINPRFYGLKEKDLPLVALLVENSH